MKSEPLLRSLRGNLNRKEMLQIYRSLPAKLQWADRSYHHLTEATPYEELYIRVMSEENEIGRV